MSKDDFKYDLIDEVKEVRKEVLEKVALQKKLGISNPGSRFKININYSYDSKTGEMIPDFSEKVDFNDLIQSSYDSCDINIIVQRAKAGDLSVLNINVPHYGDFSDIPTDLNSRYKLMKSLDDDWIKIQHSNLKNVFANREDFENSVIDNTYMKKINDYVESLKSNDVGGNE